MRPLLCSLIMLFTLCPAEENETAFELALTTPDLVPQDWQLHKLDDKILIQPKNLKAPQFQTFREWQNWKDSNEPFEYILFEFHAGETINSLLNESKLLQEKLLQPGTWQELPSPTNTKAKNGRIALYRLVLPLAQREIFVHFILINNAQGCLIGTHHSKYSININQKTEFLIQIAQNIGSPH